MGIEQITDQILNNFIESRRISKEPFPAAQMT